MPRHKRTPYVFFFCQDYHYLDPERMLAGDAELRRATQLSALSVLTRAESAVTVDELALAYSLPADRWVDISTGAEQLSRSLAERGVLVSDADGEPFRTLRERDELLRASGWNAYAALLHFFTRWYDVDVRRSLEDPTGELPPLTREDIDDFLARRGTPPPAFHAVDKPQALEPLPLPSSSDGVYDVLKRRRTTRAFDASTPLSREDLGTLLYYVFGCHGFTAVRPHVETVKRTSPSAGGLHPVEAYPLVRNVADLSPGLYHYRARDHVLELVEPLSVDDATELANLLVCGQTYFGSAHVLFLLTARFARNHWKYRYHQHAYATMLLDVGHLSQTLYVVATELGLGAYFTAAVNTALVDERLGLDGCTEGALAISGCGVPSPARSPFDPVFAPYEPERARAE